MTTSPPETGVAAPPAGGRRERFDRNTRLVHWSTAVLVLVLMATAACLYIDALSALIGRRSVVKDIHVYSGLLLPFPLIGGVIDRRAGVNLRRDLRVLNRWSPSDLRWLKSLARDPFVEHGRFHPGQKLNAAFVGGSILVLLATGSIMRWFAPFPLSWRTGATFVHDWLALAFTIVVIGHIGKALRDPEAMHGMRFGDVSTTWAKRHHPAWAEVEDGVERERER